MFTTPRALHSSVSSDRERCIMPSACSLLFDRRDALLPVPFQCDLSTEHLLVHRTIRNTGQESTRRGESESLPRDYARPPRKSRQGRDGVLAHLHTTPSRYVGMPYAQCGAFRPRAYTQEMFALLFFSLSFLCPVRAALASRRAMMAVCQPTTPRACG